jgi:hypothetical protein
VAQETKPRAREEKQPYEKPRLIVYGDLRAITAQKGERDRDDSGLPKTWRTGMP